MASIDEQFVEFIIKSLVGNPDAVQIERTIDEKGVLLELTVDPEDLGRVIGKRGATAQSIRTLLRALGTKNEARYNLKIVDNGTGSSARHSDHSSSSTNNAPTTDDQSSNIDDSVNDDNVNDEEAKDDGDQPSREESLAEKTRKELSDLDDLDI